MPPADQRPAPNLAWSSALLILSNLVPLAGVLFFNWDVFTLMLLFWLENVIIGAFNVLRMAVCAVDHAAEHLVKFVMIPFFIVHYGGFCFGHGFFIVALFGPEAIKEFDWPVTHPGDMAVLKPLAAAAGLGAVALLVSHGTSFVLNYLRGGEYRSTNIQQLMTRPYGRIVLLHVVIIFGGVLAMASGQNIAVLFLLVVAKIGLDLVAHRAERKKLGDPAPATA